MKLVAFLSFFLLFQISDWTQWLGSHRDGSVSVSSQKHEWPDQLSLVWKKQVGGGYSGPIGKNGKIWIHSRQEGREIIRCLSLKDGEVLWQQGYETPFVQDPSARTHGLGPFSTPTLRDGKLFTVSITNKLNVWDAESGQLAWRKDYSGEFDDGFPYFGNSSSPLVWEDLCFVHFGGHERTASSDYSGQGAITALDVSDGSEIWRWSGDSPALGASPMIFTIGNKTQLVFKTYEKIVGLNPRTGEEFWSIPFEVPMKNTIVTPTVIGELLITSDYRMGMYAWRISSENGSWSLRRIWKNHRVSLFMSTPIVINGALVGFSEYRKGQLFGLNPGNGQINWRGESRLGDHASLLSWGDHILVFLENGLLIVGEISRNHFRRIHEYQVGRSGMWAYPAVLEDKLIVRDGEQLLVYAF